ncbi:ArsS family sensor histidine kinase [Sulfurimonas sp. HSL-1716]|uniref:ArsS family sensor histidine kinase n=1 Tax=Hydrocurvibacter sulfurireducens TaxID=3131937 RepID=UPI0031F9CA7F
MHKHSLLRLISIFFFLIFTLINGLFYIAHQHFSKQKESEQIRRFLLADRLFHDNKQDFSAELKQLMVRPSNLSSQELFSKGKILMELPFGKMVSFKDRTFFANDRPPPPPPPAFDLGRFDLMPPPLFAPWMDHFTSVVLEDIAPHSLKVFWAVVAAVDLLILLFFAYIIRKLLPLHRLKNAIIAFKDEDATLDLPVSGNDEISQITHEFNSALNKIAAMREARSLFLRNVLHELKTPIMKGSLTTDCLESSADQQRLKRIFSRMDYLLNEFAKMENFNSGEWRLNLQEYRFVDLLDHSCDMLLCSRKSIIVHGEENQLIVKADFDLFTVALKNLLDNALKYSVSKPVLTIKADAFEICSQGEPLPAEKQDFSRPFNRDFENSSAGLGLGLYITDSVLKKHGFRLIYKYTEGYNCFHVVLN